MRYVTGVILVLIGLALVAAKSELGSAVTRSNRAATGRFSGGGWETYNRFVFVLVGGSVAAFGVALLLGFVE